MIMKLLEVENLNVSFLVDNEKVHVINDVSFDINENEVLAVIGETGCGKSVMGSAVLRLLPENAVVSGNIYYKNTDILNMPENDFRLMRGKEIASVPQSPSTSLDPLMKVGDQVAECVTIGNHIAPKEKNGLRSRVGSIFSKLKLPRNEEMYDNYPCELSGGMRQRILLSMGIITSPELLIVDEPTKAIDWVLRKDIVRELKALKDEMKCAMLFITHDLGAASIIADRIAVMYSGEIVETGPTKEVLNNPKHPYTKGLIAAMPSSGLNVMEGYMPSFSEVFDTCRFLPRCPEKKHICDKEIPCFAEINILHKVKCHLYNGGV